MTVAEITPQRILVPEDCVREPMLYEHTQESERFLRELDEWLQDRTIGPLTGLSKRFADLDLINEPYKLPEGLWLKTFAGMAACYYLRGETKMVDRMVDNPENPLTDRILMRLEKVICNPPPTEQHRLETLLYDFDQLKSIKRNLKRDLRIETHRRKSRARSDPDLVREMHHQREQLLYNTLRQFLGIKIAEGHMCGAKYYAKKLQHFPHHSTYDPTGHTGAVIDYLFEQKGAKTLSERAGFRFGTNKYFWRDCVGTPDHPGKMRKHLICLKEDLITNPFTTLAYGAVGATMYAAGNAVWARYGAQINDGLHIAGLLK